MRRLFLVTNMLVFMYSSALFAQKKPLELLENRNMEVLDQKVTDMDVTASIPNEHSCTPPMVLVYAPINFNKNSSVYLEFSLFRPTPSLQIQVIGNDKIYFVGVVNENKLLVENLPHNQKFKVLAMDECKNLVPIFEFDTETTKLEKQPYQLSPYMFRTVSKYFMEKEPKINLVEFLYGLKDLSNYEKLAFLQHHLLDRKPFAFTTTYDLPNKEIFENGAKSFTCRCTFVFTPIQSGDNYTHPGWSNNNSGFYQGDWSGTDPATCSWTLGNNNRFRYYSLAGASRFQALTQYNTRGSNTFNLFGYSNDGQNIPSSSPADANTAITSPLSPNSSWLEYNLLCSGQNQIPAECSCDKSIILNYSYSGNYRLKTSINCGFLQSGCEAYAEVDDAVALYYIKVASPTETQSAPILLDKGRARYISRCGRNNNPDFGRAIGRLFGNTAGLIANYFTDGKIDPTLMNQWGDNVGAILATPMYTNTGQCTDETYNVNLLRKSQTIQLSMNRPISVVMSSVAKTFVGGKNYHSADLTMNTSFHMTGILTGYYDAVNWDNCCSPWFLNWNCHPLSSKAADVANGISLWKTYFPSLTTQPYTGAVSPSNFSSEVGFLKGMQSRTCQTVWETPLVEIQGEWGMTVPTYNVHNSSEGVVLDVDNLKSKYTYKVLSIYGDVLSEGSSTEKTSLVLPRGKELGNPFVIISILDGNTPKNFKINTNLYE